MTNNKKIQKLFTLGEAEQIGQWHDYLQYQFGAEDCEELLALVGDRTLLFDASIGSKETWVPTHAWRALGQIGCVDAVQPLIDLFDVLANDEWAIVDMPSVMSHIGPAAIHALAEYMLDSNNSEMARSLASDSLSLIALDHQSYRSEVLDHYQTYLQAGEPTVAKFNGLFLCNVLNVHGVELIEDVRAFFDKNDVDVFLCGHLEAIEEGLLEMDVDTAMNNYTQNVKLKLLEKPDADDMLGLIDYYLLHYDSGQSIKNLSELDGYFAAFICFPKMPEPTNWLFDMWGGEQYLPKWKNSEEFSEFSTSVFMNFNYVSEHMKSSEYNPLFHKRTIGGKVYHIVDDWCQGFARAMFLCDLSASDITAIETLAPSILRIAQMETDEDFAVMDDQKMEALQNQINPELMGLYLHFKPQRDFFAGIEALSVESFVRDKPKVGRNDPCPCGSGKKFKKCCLH